MTKPRTKTSEAPRPVAVPTPPEAEWRPKILSSNDVGRELNPVIAEELEVGQRNALEVAAVRLGESPSETVRRLVGVALFLTGLDPASEDEATETLFSILGDSDQAQDAGNALLRAAGEAHLVTISLEKEDRAAFLRARRAEVERVVGRARA